MDFRVYRFHQFAQLSDALLGAVGVGLRHQIDIEVVGTGVVPVRLLRSLARMFCLALINDLLFGQMLAGHVVQ
jgi:hypothetical protein